MFRESNNEYNGEREVRIVGLDDGKGDTSS